VGSSSQALLAFFALSNADILVARATMSDSEAGLYAAGLIMAKAILFLPQFLVVIAFPSMSKEETNRRTLLLAMGLSAALGSVAVLCVLLMPDVALLFVGARPGERILDTCASPGGKTTAMAAAMSDEGLIVATDLRGRRVELLARTVAVSGARSIRVLRADAEQPLPFFPVFDAVLVDAPCSGLGIIRRDPDVKWRRTEADFVALASAQRRLLDQAAGVLRTGGRLIYATCSSEPEENDEVVDAFLEARPDFRPGQPPELSEAVQALVDRRGRMRTLPHKDRLESFFAATLVKRSDSQ